MNNTTEQKQFINGLWVQEKSFDNGNTILKLSILPEKFIESIKSVKVNEKGYIKLIISKKKSLGENGDSHYCYVDTWQPSGQKPSDSVKPVKPVVKKVAAPKQEEVVDDDNSF